jgi:hypothetical protein
MNEKHFHGKSHGRLHVDVPDNPLTEAEKLANHIALMETILKAIDPQRFPVLFDKIKIKLADLKSEAETARDAEWLAPAMTFENGEAQEVRPYHSDNGTEQHPF